MQVGVVSPHRVMSGVDGGMRGAGAIVKYVKTAPAIGNEDVVIHDDLRGVGQRQAALASVRCVNQDSVPVGRRSSAAGVGIEIIPGEITRDVDVRPWQRIRLYRLINADAACAGL